MQFNMLSALPHLRAGMRQVYADHGTSIAAGSRAMNLVKDEEGVIDLIATIEKKKVARSAERRAKRKAAERAAPAAPVAYPPIREMAEAAEREAEYARLERVILEEASEMKEQLHVLLASLPYEPHMSIPHWAYTHVLVTLPALSVAHRKAVTEEDVAAAREKADGIRGFMYEMVEILSKAGEPATA